MLARIRKALIAGLGAGLGAGVTVILKANFHFDSVTLSQALGAAIAVGVPVAWATWQVPNAKALAPYAPK
jgi:uncharacterized membrane protein YjjB (DUF3815 family)